MAVQPTQKFKPKTPGPKGSPYILLVELIIIIIVAYLVATWIINALAVTAVSGSTALTMTNTTTLFSLNGAQYAGLLVSASNSYARIAVTKQPTFLNPTFYIDLYSGNTTNFNGTGKYANMQIELVSATSKSAQVTITPISAGLTIPPDISRISVVQTTLTPFGLSQAVGLSSNATTSSTTTTVSQGSTTTISQSSSQDYYSDALATLHINPYYALMKNYSNIYVDAAANCTPPIYNQSYNAKYGVYPSGADTFENISKLVPYSLSMSFTNSSPINYSAVYSTQSDFPQISSGTVLTLVINAASNSVVNTTLSGFFQGLTLSRLQCGYEVAHNFGNACGMYVTSSQVHASSC